MISRLHNYLHALRVARQKHFTFVRPTKKETEKVVRAVIARHKEALKELGDR